MNKKRPTRKDKERRHARQLKAAGVTERAQLLLEQLISRPAEDAGLSDVSEALAGACQTGIYEDWNRAVGWAASGACSDDDLAHVAWAAIREVNTDRRFILACQAVLSLHQAERVKAALVIGKYLAESGDPAAIPRDQVCAAAVQFLTTITDESWVEALLTALPDNHQLRAGLGSPPMPDTGGTASELRASELFWSRAGGSRAVRGFDYQSQVGLLYVVRSIDPSSGIKAVAFERLEDVELTMQGTERHPDLTGLGDRVFVQAKSRDASQGNWTISRLADEGVISHFAQLHEAEPTADLLFVSNRDLGESAVALDALCAKLRCANLTIEQLAALPAASPLRASGAQVAAANELRTRMGNDGWDDRALSALLSHLHMQQLPEALRDSAIVAIGSATEQPVNLAALMWYRLYYEVFERSGARQAITSDRATALVREVTESTRTTMGEAADASHLIRELNLSPRSDPDPAYLLGVRATLRHILAKQDVVRPNVNDAISAAFQHHNLCVVRSPSGQGKSTCMYRWATDHADHFRAWEVKHVAEVRQAQVIADLVMTETPTAANPMLILVDDLFSGDKSQLSALLERLAEIPHVYILATSREDEWRDIRPRGIAMEVVRLGLDEATAKVLRDMLQREGVRTEMHWREAFELAQAQSGSALLMEYLHYLQRGESMQQTLREQLACLDNAPPSLADSLYSVVRYVATLDKYDCAVSWGTLEGLLGIHATDLRKCIKLLTDEHLIQERMSGEFVGLHRMRSEVLSSICAETVPLSTTIGKLLSLLPPAELIALAEPALADATVDPYPLLDILWDRIVSESFDADFIPRVLAAVFAADQHRFASECHRRLEGLRVRTPVLALLPSERLPNGTRAEIFDLPQMPADAKAARDALPERPLEAILLHRLLRRDRIEELASKLRRLPAAPLGAALDWIGYGNGNIATAVLPLLCLGDDARLFTNADAVDMAALISAVRRINPTAAEKLYREFGGDEAFVAKLLSEDYRLTRLAATAPNSWEIEWSFRGDHPQTSVPVLATRADDPDGISWELGQLLLRAVPRAESVEVWARDETGGTLGFRDYPMGRKHVLREKSYQREDVERNVAWAEAFLRPYRAVTWAALAHQLHEARELAVQLTTELTGLLCDTFPATGSAGPPRVVLPASLHQKGVQLQRMSHSLPFLPVFAPSQHWDVERQTTIPNRSLPEYFAHLLRAFEFFVLGTNEPDDHQTLLALVNSGMALYEQQEMLSALTAEGRGDVADTQLAVEERRALATLYAVMRTCRRNGFGRAKVLARDALPLLRGCHRVLMMIAETTTPDSGMNALSTGRLLAHAVSLSDELTSRCRGPRTLLLGQSIRACQADPTAGRALLDECVALCEDLDDPIGVALAAEIVDGTSLQRWQSQIEAALSASVPSGFSVTHAAATVAPRPDKSGFRPHQVLLGVPSAKFAASSDACAEVVAAVARTIRSEPAQLKIMPVAGSGVLPEVGWLLHVGGYDEPADAEAVQARWFAFIPDPEDAAGLGLPLADKSAMSEAVDAAFARLVSGLSWAAWLAMENGRRDPSLLPRVQHVTVLCEREATADLEELVEIEAILGAELEGRHEALAEETQLWVRDCGSCIQRHLEAARQAEMDDGLISLLGTLLKGQSVTDAGRVTPDDLELMYRHWDLKAKTLAAYDGG